MRIATWNVNSIRSRIDRVEDWLERADLDVLAMQETKARDDQFPDLTFEALGYEVAHVGVNQWNGVAIVSRVGLDDVEVGFDGMPGWGEPIETRGPRDRRHRAAASGSGRSTSPTGASSTTRTWSTSSTGWPGCATPPPAGSPRTRPAQIALIGDWNIAPLDEDVWEHGRSTTTSTHVSPAERAAFQAVVDAGFSDLVRPYAPGPGTYTYWDYQQLRFPKKQGMRIDFVARLPGAGRPGEARRDRPRGAQGQGAVRPRAGPRRARRIAGHSPGSPTRAELSTPLPGG